MISEEFCLLGVPQPFSRVFFKQRSSVSSFSIYSHTFGEVFGKVQAVCFVSQQGEGAAVGNE